MLSRAARAPKEIAILLARGREKRERFCAGAARGRWTHSWTLVVRSADWRRGKGREGEGEKTSQFWPPPPNVGGFCLLGTLIFLQGGKEGKKGKKEHAGDDVIRRRLEFNTAQSRLVVVQREDKRKKRGVVRRRQSRVPRGYGLKPGASYLLEV